MTELRELERDIPFSTNGNGAGGADYMVLRWIGMSGLLAPPYWSQGRDKWLREFWLRSDYLKITVATFASKVTTIPLYILPQDRSVKAHTAQAERMRFDLMRNSGLLKGFKNELSKFVADWLTQDNGAFMLVMGPGKADGPITGPVSGVLHLDSQRCNRTGNVEFPVTYEHIDGKRYALHYTRVIFMSALPSADVELYDVGLCAVSRTIDSAQELIDMSQYMQEKLGSRPARQILYAKEGATLDQLSSASAATNAKLDSQGLDRFAKTMLLAPKIATQKLDLGLIDLASTPDGFNRKEITMLDVAVIATAFGLDMRDLAHAFGVAGQTRADAEVQNQKTQGKGVGQFLSEFTDQLNTKVLPPHLYAEFDYIDDTQDEAAANIRRTRSEYRERDIRSGVTTVRVEREQMLADGEITQAQFDEMELEEGRLPDGLDVLMLYQSVDSEIAPLLNLGVDDPTDIEANDGTAILAAIHEQQKAAWQRHDNAPNANIRRKVRQALAALDRLRGLYEIEPAQEALEQAQADMQAQADGMVEDDQIADDGEPAPPQNAEPPPEVKAMLTKQEAELTGIEDEYRAEFEDLVTQAVEGEITQPDFIDRLSELVAAMLFTAMIAGSEWDDDELSIEMSTRLQLVIDQNLDAVRDFANDIYEGRYSPDGLGIVAALGRISLWAGTLGSVYAMGQTYRRDDPFLRWEWSPLKDHCEDCRRLNGQVHRASEWRQSGWVPRGRMLACHGYRCGCAFIPAEGPATGSF